MPAITVTTTAARPELIAAIAPYLWREWGVRRGRTVETVAAMLASRTAARGPEQCFVVLEDGQPAATASFVNEDLDPRPDLAPWLASVFTLPDFRGRGHAVRAVRAVEASARAAGIAAFYLHTESAAALYARLGWVAFGEAVDLGHKVTLMRRDL